MTATWSQGHPGAGQPLRGGGFKRYFLILVTCPSRENPAIYLRRSTLGCLGSGQALADKVPEAEHVFPTYAGNYIAGFSGGIFSQEAQELPPVLPPGGGDYPQLPGKRQEHIDIHYI